MSMGINGMYGGILQNYRVPTIPSVSVEEVKKQDEQRLQMEQAASSQVKAYDEPSVPAVRKPDAQLEDIAITFNKQDDFGYIGKDSDIHSLDVEQAIGDMQKDKMLQQYQYFVGSSQDVASKQTPDGIVIPKF